MKYTYGDYLSNNGRHGPASTLLLFQTRYSLHFRILALQFCKQQIKFLPQLRNCGWQVVIKTTALSLAQCDRLSRPAKTTSPLNPCQPMQATNTPFSYCDNVHHSLSNALPASSSKKYGTITPPAYNLHQTVTRGECIGFS